ncbi:hypothetical protein [Acinetobacter portensis]|uniref:hypothetical protein n=1 Tax=Acinetobacter portensis TaxID=1839785 RepID=UPI0013D71CE3|nr:hypothetical protein [Acinetobacter portensis]
MKEVAKITLYEINKCGLYKFKKDEKPILGDLTDFLEQLEIWAKQPDMFLANTCTYAPIGTDDSYKTYCYDIISNSYLTLLTLWIEVPKTKGNKILSVSSKATVGNVTVNTANIKKGDIPGYAAYFLFFKDKNIMATINFDHSMNGRQNLEKYLTEFISKISSYAESEVQKDNDGNSLEIIKYRKSEDDEAEFLTAYFETRLVRNKTNIDFLKENFDLIRKIHKHNEIPFFKHENKAYWQKFPTFSSSKTEELTAKYSLEMKYRPCSSEEIETIITDWENSHKATKWEDLGFTVQGKSSPIWLSGTIARNDFEINISRSKDEIVNPNILLTELNNIKNQILNLQTS